MRGTPGVVRKWEDGREFVEKPDFKLRMRRRMVRPGAGEIWMRCGNCGGRSFKPLVTPVADTGRVTGLVCDDSRGGGCLRVYKLDLAGCLEGGGNLNRG